MKKKLISQLVCVTMALSLMSVSALAEETNAAAEVNEGAAEGKEEGKTEPQEAPKEEVDVSQRGMIIREFDDYHEISEYALRSLTWALNSGIISGKGNAVLDPKGSATRAEVASMLMRFCETFVK
mgnify:CR=1 FL=1